MIRNISVLPQWGVVLVVGGLGKARSRVSPGAYITTDCCCCCYVTATVQQHLLREAHIVLKKMTFFTHKQKPIVKKKRKEKQGTAGSCWVWRICVATLQRAISEGREGERWFDWRKSRIIKVKKRFKGNILNIL